MSHARYRLILHRLRSRLSARLGRLLAAHLGRRVLHGLDDIVIACAAAQVALQAMTNLFFARVRITLQQIAGGYDHTGGAVAALEPVALPEAFLQGVQLAVLRQPFDGGDLRAVGLNRQYGAGFDADAIEHDSAGATLAGIAADVGSGQPKRIAQIMHQQRSWLDIALVGPTVDCDRD